MGPHRWPHMLMLMSRGLLLSLRMNNSERGDGERVVKGVISPTSEEGRQ